MVGAGGPVVGLVVGGPVVEAFGWRWIFVAQVPLTLITLLIASTVLPDTRSDRVSTFDLPGAATLGVSTLSLLIAINRGPIVGWTRPLVLGGFAIAAVCAFAFVSIERRTAHPLLPLAYLRQRNFSAPLTFALAGPVAGYLALHVGERVSATLGASALVLSMIALAHLRPADGDMLVIGSLALSGLGMGASSPAMAAAIANSVDDEDLGVAGATMQMTGQIGATLGMQVLQTVQVARASAAGGVGSYHDAYLVGAAVTAMGLATALCVRRTSFAVEPVYAAAATT